MPTQIDSRPIGPIGGIDLGLAKRYLAEVQRALSAINYSDVWKHVGAVIKCGNVTVDTRKHHGGRGVCVKMLIAALNDSSWGKTVAEVNIADHLRRYADGEDKQMKKWIAQVLKAAFVKSLNTGQQFQVDD
jgi:hypothetical protein